MRNRYLHSLIAYVGIATSLIGCGSPPPVRGVKAVRSAVESTVSSITSGTVRAERTAELAFGTVGRVQELNIQLGDRVTRNQVLAELENQDLRSSVAMAEKEFHRIEGLQQSRVAAVQDLDRAREQLSLAQAAYEKSLVRAPFDGIVAERNIEKGQLSQITAIVPKPLIRLIDTEPRYVKAEIDEVDLGKIKAGLSARVKVLAARSEPFQGKVRKVVPYVSSVREQDRTAEVELSVDSEGILLPEGSSADIDIVVNRVEDVTAVPTRALLGPQGKRFVFTYYNGRAKKSPVEVGLYNYDRSEIKSGIAVGDIVLFPGEGIELEDQLKVAAQVAQWE